MTAEDRGGTTAASEINDMLTNMRLSTGVSQGLVIGKTGKMGENEAIRNNKWDLYRTFPDSQRRHLSIF